MITFDQNEESPTEWEIGKDLPRLTKSINLQFRVLNAGHGITIIYQNKIIIKEVRVIYSLLKDEEGLRELVLILQMQLNFFDNFIRISK